MNRSQMIQTRALMMSCGAVCTAGPLYESRAMPAAPDNLHSGEYFIQKGEEAAAKANGWLWSVVIAGAIMVIWQLCRMAFS